MYRPYSGWNVGTDALRVVYKIFIRAESKCNLRFTAVRGDVVRDGFQFCEDLRLPER